MHTIVTGDSILVDRRQDGHQVVGPDNLCKGESCASAGLARFTTKLGAGGYDYAEYWIDRLPQQRANRAARTAVKRVVGFRYA
jgi:hypothetical protein